MVKPDFIVAGGMRCATGWIRECLKEHPDLFMARKEPHYYDRNYEKGSEWYSEFFDGHSGEQLVGEKTATYLHYADTQKRIIETNPEVKVIICLRDPVERMYSHYSMFSENDPELKKTGFVESAKPGTNFVEWSRYFEQVSQYMATIPSENLKIVIYEEKDADPLGFIQGLFGFLGVDSSFKAPSAELRIKRGQFEHNHWFWGNLSKIMLHPRSPTMFKQLYSGLRPNERRQELDVSAYEKLAPLFDDVPALEELLGRKLDCWRTRRYVDK